MHNTLSNLLSKLYIAEKKNKKLIILNSSTYNLALLNILWRDGFIYGYEKTYVNKINVFLKHGNSFGYFSNIIFLKKQKVCLKELKHILSFNKNSYYLVLTSKGILSGYYCISKNIGGYLIAKL